MNNIIMDIDGVHHETYSKLLIVIISILLSVPDVYFSSTITNLKEIIQKPHLLQNQYHIT